MHTIVYVHDSERVGKYESRSVGLDVKVFRPRCGPGQQGLCLDGWTSRSSRCQLSALPQRARAKPGAALQRRSSPSGLRSLCHFLSLRGGRTAQSSAPHLHQPSPNVSALHSDTRSPGHRPSSSHLRPCAPAPPLPRLPSAPALCLPSRSTASACLCAGLRGWTKPKPKDDSRAEPSKEEAGRKIQNPCT